MDCVSVLDSSARFQKVKTKLDYGTWYAVKIKKRSLQIKRSLQTKKDLKKSLVTKYPKSEINGLWE